MSGFDRFAPCPNCKSNQNLDFCSGELHGENAASVMCQCGVAGPYVYESLLPDMGRETKAPNDHEHRATMAWNRHVKVYSERPGLELDRGKILGLKTALRLIRENQDVPLQARIGMIHGLISALDGTAQPIYTSFDTTTDLHLDIEEA